MTVYLIAILISLFSFSEEEAASMSDQEKIETMLSKGATVEQINEELVAAGYEGSGLDLE